MAYNANACSNCGFANPNTPSDSYVALPDHLLQSNELPTDEEIAQIENAISDRKARVLLLDKTIVALQSSLEQHRRMRQAAADQISRGVAILSVVRRIPTDVLAEIFNWTVPDEARKHATNRCPWVLGRVCSRWRALSLALPELWTTIDRKLPLAMVKAHLDRSIPYPLTVELGFSDTGSVELLIACSSRWEVADVEMRAFMGPALGAVQGRIPVLRRLRYNDNNGFRSFGAFENAPALRDVALSGKASPLLPWGQLERLNLKLSNSAGLSQLWQAHNLVELSVTGRPHEPLSVANLMELPRLRTLLIKDGLFLESLSLPALEDLYVSMDVSSLPSFLQRSNCQLKKFTTDVQCVSASIIAVLEHTSSLVELRITAIQDVHLLLSRLTIPASEMTAYARPLVPALSALAISNVGDALACTQLVAMAESRRSSPVCAEPSLCVLDFIKWTGLNLHALETLAVLRERGFTIEWLTGPHSMDRYRSWRPSYP
ncbi:hypothetical protein MSAN_00425600 [Mycena sanguinolenta]|uniref:F-box domain-containing protein n=1 Tax=Mycena sanguinolenta TaxID=230812 RepID=A0A8H6ZGW8_9AGAR|nr:hypothetical protein MSAN_00425600 [Mycena sanguinolenta]